MKKSHNQKPTHKQRAAVKKIIENHGNISKSMLQVGYTEATAKNPSNLTNSKGFKQLCLECGLTEELVLNSLTSDIIEKPRNRKPELELGAKILGILSDKIKVEADGGFVPNIIFYNEKPKTAQNDAIK